MKSIYTNTESNTTVRLFYSGVTFVKIPGGALGRRDTSHRIPW